MGNVKRVVSLLLLVFISMQMFGCAVHLPEPEVISSEDEALAMGFSAGDYNGKLTVGEYEWLPVNLKIDYQYALKWFSANPEIATVDSNGRVDAIAPGTTTITATANKASLDYKVTVTKGTRKPLSSSTAYSVDESSLQQNIAGMEVLANPYAILINVNTSCATVYTYNDSGVYSKAVRAMVCSVGKGENSTLGSYTISNKNRWNYDNDGKYYQYHCAIDGTSSLALSSTAYKAQSASELITSEYNKLGTASTNGEIRFCVDDAKWIYDNCQEGTLVKIVSSDNKRQDPLGVPTPIRVSEDSEYKNWDPTDPNENNPYKKVVPVFEGAEDTYIKLNGTFDAYNGVVALDTCKNRFTDGIKVDGKVVCTRKGEYIITYYYTDAMGRTGRTDRKIYVVSSSEYDAIKATESE